MKIFKIFLATLSAIAALVSIPIAHAAPLPDLCPNPVRVGETSFWTESSLSDLDQAQIHSCDPNLSSSLLSHRDARDYRVQHGKKIIKLGRVEDGDPAHTAVLGGGAY